MTRDIGHKLNQWEPYGSHWEVVFNTAKLAFSFPKLAPLLALINSLLYFHRQVSLGDDMGCQVGCLHSATTDCVDHPPVPIFVMHVFTAKLFVTG